MNTKTKYASDSVCFNRSIAVASFALMLLMPDFTKANDGLLDVDNEFPAVGTILEVATRDGRLRYVGGYCSGSLIAPDMFLTAGHCQFFDTRALLEVPGFEVEYWVAFDNIVTDNDFRCYLHDINHPNAGDVGCNPGAVNGVSFHKGTISIVHPDYTRVIRRGGGPEEIIETGMRGKVVDLAVVLLETPVDGISPLATASLESFNHTDHGLPLTNVGYGLNYHKSIPAKPDQPGWGGPTVFEGNFGLRRIADIGTLRTVRGQEMVPTQQSSLGEGSVCYGDSGSPLFFRETDGSVNQTVSGVLTGAALWCMGAQDPFARVDTLEAVSFLNCIKASSTVEEACECGIEEELGLCS
jgi:hypothetical protein